MRQGLSERPPSPYALLITLSFSRWLRPLAVRLSLPLIYFENTPVGDILPFEVRPA
jgi:hypothetical protein